MNSLELKMVEILKELRNDFCVVGIKAEFEAEGTRTEELMRLKEICLRAGLSLTLKIGGCEAIRDMYDARAVGVNHLVSPMVESSFALSKYLKAIDIAFPLEEQEDVEFLINIETISAVENFDDMLDVPEIKKLNGIVIGRSDLSGSMGIDKKDINGTQIFEITKSTLMKAKENNLTTVIGGTISIESIPFLKALIDLSLINRFETRKVCFSCPDALKNGIKEGITKSLIFELMWLQNKKNHYDKVSREDEERLSSLTKRFS